jgi:hypothetical protein
MLPSDIPLPAVQEKSEFSFAADNDDDGSSKSIQVIGFASDDEPIVVRLDGQMNRTEFWRPQPVIDELKMMLSSDLNVGPALTSATSEGGEGEGGGVGSGGDSGSTPRQSRRNLLARVMPSLRPEQPSPGNNPEVGLRQADTSRMVMVKARLEEICLRTVSEFGLYDTMSKQCVIIQVDARCWVHVRMQTSLTAQEQLKYGFVR